VTAGYSGTPLAKKLGVKEGHRVTLIDAPHDWRSAPPIQRATPSSKWYYDVDVVIAFINDAASLDREIESLANTITPDGSLWIAWPRKAAGHRSDITDNIVEIRYWLSVLVDVKGGVAALDDDWSALKMCGQGVTPGDTPVTTSALPTWSLMALGAVLGHTNADPTAGNACVTSVGAGEFSVVLEATDRRRYLSDRLCGRRRCRCVSFFLSGWWSSTFCGGGARRDVRASQHRHVGNRWSFAERHHPRSSIVWRTACARGHDVAELLA